jgi:hypothetical protein
MSLSPFYQFSRRFREEIGRVGGYEPTPEFYQECEADVLQYSTSVCNDRVPLMPGQSKDRIDQFWKSRSDRIMVKRAQMTT